MKCQKILNKKNLIQLYIKEHKNTTEISKKLNCDKSTVWKYLNKFNLSRGRSLSQLGIYNNNYRHGNNCKGKKHYCPDCGKKIKYCSLRCASCSKKHQYKIKPESNPSFGRKGKFSPCFGKTPKHGKGSYYKNIWMRSSWEAAYAKYLTKNHIKWQYESKTFDLGNMTYTPDFYLPETDTYVEIKGWWRDKAKIKFELFKSIYYKKKIRILFQKDLRKLKII
jgi:hypothetical protein